jgi:hypothetical protein
MGEEADKEDSAFITRIGPVDVDWPRTVGFYGGVAAAIAFDLIAPELAIFVAAVPLIKLMKRKNATTVERAIAAVLEGAAKPVGGDADSTVRPAWLDDERQEKEHRGAPQRVKRVTLEGVHDAAVELFSAMFGAASWVRRTVSRQREHVEDLAAEGRARFEARGARSWAA